MTIRRFYRSPTCAIAALIVSACGGARRHAVPQTTSEPAALTSGAVQPGSSNIGVSGEIARICKLDVNDLKSAPKYAFDRSDLLPDDRTTLAKIADCLTTGPLKNRSVQLIGRADARGESNYNMALGAHRAGGVADYLAHLGVARARLDVTSRGELDAVGVDEGGWQSDRRVDIVLAR